MTNRKNIKNNNRNKRQGSGDKIPLAGPDNMIVSGVAVGPRYSSSKQMVKFAPQMNKQRKQNQRSRDRTSQRLDQRLQLPQFTLAQLDVFDSRAFGVKVPDEASAPSAVGFSRGEDALGTGAQAGNVFVYRYHPKNYLVTANIVTATTWTYAAAFVGGFAAPNLPAIQTSFSSIRTVAFGVKITTRQSYTNASGFVHVALVPELLDGTTWVYPTSVAAMEYAPVYRRIPVADLIENDILVMSKFTDASAFRYYDPARPDFISPATNGNPVSTNGWMAIQIAYEGVANGTALIDIEYLAHYETLTGTVGAQGVIEVTRASPHSPAIMAATSFTVEEIQQIRVVEESSNDEPSFWDDAYSAFKTGLNIANGVARVVGKLAAIIL